MFKYARLYLTLLIVLVTSLMWSLDILYWRQCKKLRLL